MNDAFSKTGFRALKRDAGEYVITNLGIYYLKINESHCEYMYV